MKDRPAGRPGGGERREPQKEPTRSRRTPSVGLQHTPCLSTEAVSMRKRIRSSSGFVMMTPAVRSVIHPFTRDRVAPRPGFCRGRDEEHHTQPASLGPGASRGSRLGDVAGAHGSARLGVLRGARSLPPEPGRQPGTRKFWSPRWRAGSGWLLGVGTRMAGANGPKQLSQLPERAPPAPAKVQPLRGRTLAYAPSRQAGAPVKGRLSRASWVPSGPREGASPPEGARPARADPTRPPQRGAGRQGCTGGEA